MTLIFTKCLTLGAVDNGGGGETPGGGGTDNYIDLRNKPSINGVSLVGNKTTADLKIEMPDISDKQDKTDERLTTSNKEIVAAINELDTDIENRVDLSLSNIDMAGEERIRQIAGTGGATADLNGIRGDYCSRYGIIDLPSPIEIQSGEIVIPAGTTLIVPNKASKVLLGSTNKVENPDLNANFTVFYLDGGTFFCAEAVLWQEAEPDGEAQSTAWWNPKTNEWQFKSNDTGNVFRAAAGTPLLDAVVNESGNITRVDIVGYRHLNNQVFASQADMTDLKNDFESLMTKADDNARDITSLTTRVTALENNETSIYEQIDALETRMNDMLARIEVMEAKWAAIEGKIVVTG